MTIILDENLPRPLKGIFPNHTVTTVQEQQLAGTVNGALLARLEGAFDFLITRRALLAAVGALHRGVSAQDILDFQTQMPPSPQDAARRLLVLLAISAHALRLMMVWDFTFRTAAAMKSLTGQTPGWRSLGLRGERLKLRARWNWFWERRAVREVLLKLDLSNSLAGEEREFLRLGLSAASRAKACGFSWQIESAACGAEVFPGLSGVAAALRLRHDV